MNKLRRKHLEEIAAELDEIRDRLETLKEEEEKCRDNIPETLQGSEKYAAAKNACENLDSAVSGLDDVIACIGEAVVGETVE